MPGSGGGGGGGQKESVRFLGSGFIDRLNHHMYNEMHPACSARVFRTINC